jgi:hypothetical protein
LKKTLSRYGHITERFTMKIIKHPGSKTLVLFLVLIWGCGKESTGVGGSGVSPLGKAPNLAAPNKEALECLRNRFEQNFDIAEDNYQAVAHWFYKTGKGCKASEVEITELLKERK